MDMQFVNGLPEFCYVLNSVSNEVIMVKRGEMGFYGTRDGNEPWYGQETADALNADLGVTKGQAQAMKNGSLFGWNVPAARPETYGFMENRIMVKAQKVDPQAVIIKGQRGGFETTVINVMEDGSERKYRVSCSRKKDLMSTLKKLPVDSVKGMGLTQDGFMSIEIFAYNGV